MKLAFVFPGQGSQYTGMLQDFASQKIIKDTYDIASDTLSYDLWAIRDKELSPNEDIANGNINSLDNTVNTQPALLTAGYALWRLWRSQGGAIPKCMAGHSLGEYTALVCANSLDFTDALQLTRNRGKYMQISMGENKGSMAAILGLDITKVEEICNETSSVSYVYPANINSPKQIVISGYARGVEAALSKAKAAGAKRVVELQLSVPSHCALMQSAADLLTDDLAKINIRMPEIPVFHNVDYSASTSPDEIRDKLTRQLIRSVQWVKTVQTMQNQGIDTVIECGPKKVLSSLNRSISSDIQTYSIGEELQTFNSILKSCSN